MMQLLLQQTKYNNVHVCMIRKVSGQNGTKYRIAGNFRGSKLLRIRPKIIFTELIFVNFIILPFCTVLFIISRIYFRESQKN